METITKILQLQNRLKEICKVEESIEKAIDLTGKQPMAMGAYANVYQITTDLLDPQFATVIKKDASFVVKVPHSAAFVNRVAYEQQLLHEVTIALPISHIRYFPAMYGYIQLPQTQEYGIVMEHVDHPSLAVALTEGSIAMLPLSKRIRICLDLIRGLGELHMAGIIHKDLKPENLLYCGVIEEEVVNPRQYRREKDQNRSDDNNKKEKIYTSIKITDFGVSSFLQTMTGTGGRAHGTIGYEAPEICLSDETNILPAKSSDIYSLALILFEILEGRRVFANLTPTQILTQYVLQGKRPQWTAQSTVPVCIREIIAAGWNATASQRPSIYAFLDGFYYWMQQDADGNDIAATTTMAMIPSFIDQIFLPTKLTTMIPTFPGHVDYTDENILDWNPKLKVYWQILSAVVLRLKAGDIEFLEALCHECEDIADEWTKYEQRANAGWIV